MTSRTQVYKIGIQIKHLLIKYKEMSLKGSLGVILPFTNDKSKFNKLRVNTNLLLVNL